MAHCGLRPPRWAGYTGRRFVTVIRFNEQGRDGLINLAGLGAPAKLNTDHREFLAQILDEGPAPPTHGVGRWRPAT